MNVLIILIFSTLHGANIREIYEIGKEIPDFNKSEDYRSPTDFTDEHRFLCGLGGLEFEWVTQISQMTQIFFDLFGQIHTDYLRTYAVPLVGDRNLRGWLRVLTQQSCDCFTQ